MVILLPRDWDCELKTSNLKRFYLMNAALHWKVASLFVLSCKALEVFHYHYEALMEVPRIPEVHPSNALGPPLMGWPGRRTASPGALHHITDHILYSG